ncbi:PIN-like domain-containing protein [Pseudomonas aeruginosa]|uniref:PIN-like domain-containing protein n=1 Tax=Pseudomonas aeruginosa TaxID=287 RepID=UPI0011837A91|nr:PIN-like domain-containing protein [Pseudomonas aeruginosa]HCL3684777.1 DUF4935 domain-containing protein [Pseudomonas aeruginosa]HEK0143395.1 DUF4935 domain-containing protein [Pseudomonas aeruginosa]HEP9534941.1 DUF4935 domain-containing protein [Pseudomonas aeruginosa]
MNGTLKQLLRSATSFLKALRTSGTEVYLVMDDQILERLNSVLDRKLEINSLGSLTASITAKQKEEKDLNETAIAIDSSAFLRINRINRSEDVIDYLLSQHKAPLILPGQVIQEFWNNQLNVIDTQAVSLKKKHEDLKALTSKIDSVFEEFHSDMDKLLLDFETNHGYIYDESTKHSTMKALKALEQKAIVPYVPRLRFCQMAAARKRTRTPPGFKDDGDGDFYVWLDLLYGLMKTKHQGVKFSHVIFVTNDAKVDWSRNGMPHPILAAEMEAAVGATLEVLKVEQFGTMIINKSSL